MINYTKNIWQDGSVAHAASAARMGVIETGVFDAHWRDAVRVAQTGNVTIASAVWTDLTFNVERYDQGNMFNIATPHKITVATSGIHALGANASFLTRSSGFRGLRLVHGTASVTTVIAQYRVVAVQDGSNSVLEANTDYAAAAGDYFVAQVYQSSATTLGLETPAAGANYAKEFWVRHVAAF